MVTFYRGECLGSPHTGYGGDSLRTQTHFRSSRKKTQDLASVAHTGVPLGATVPEGMGFKDHISRAENIEK